MNRNNLFKFDNIFRRLNACCDLRPRTPYVLDKIREKHANLAQYYRSFDSHFAIRDAGPDGIILVVNSSVVLLEEDNLISVICSCQPDEPQRVAYDIHSLGKTVHIFQVTNIADICQGSLGIGWNIGIGIGLWIVAILLISISFKLIGWHMFGIAGIVMAITFIVEHLVHYIFYKRVSGKMKGFARQSRPGSVASQCISLISILVSLISASGLLRVIDHIQDSASSPQTNYKNLGLTHLAQPSLEQINQSINVLFHSCEIWLAIVLSLEAIARTFNHNLGKIHKLDMFPFLLIPYLVFWLWLVAFHLKKVFIDHIVGPFSHPSEIPKPTYDFLMCLFGLISMVFILAMRTVSEIKQTRANNSDKVIFHTTHRYQFGWVCAVLPATLILLFNCCCWSTLIYDGFFSTDTGSSLSP
ncbi:hypothetical protein NEHOM01_0508 [Nematocida homosporus]|uniref:uncharacterized protein n=1 Tax=Nematocida homosporus TaxID=1912981 RepID=UPI002220DBE8|nr:uncharacterized protein NEHOM01_0508 [Nematocida homosporus]KAI5184957.1 hypothetical protein NEHOM01_0508 [Nematocida homosporus]